MGLPPPTPPTPPHALSIPLPPPGPVCGGPGMEWAGVGGGPYVYFIYDIGYRLSYLHIYIYIERERDVSVLTVTLSHVVREFQNT